MADRQHSVEVMWRRRDEFPDELPFDIDGLEPLREVRVRPIRVLSAKELDEIDAEVAREMRLERFCYAVENISFAIAIAAAGTVVGTWIASEAILQATLLGWL
ncbi:MAG: hypothetical protein D6724_09385 [Armatimonadetes bacterium]|nr:MAG: hypothetical protein D6724_09385 [Armatimonadota bacterium]